MLVHWDEVDGHEEPQTQNNLRHFLAWEGCLIALATFLAKPLKSSQVGCSSISKIINLPVGNYQSMTFADRANVEGA